jgi:ElaB/YqjD/DUF883 family membrane-anchored ribosome-binding protein
MAGASDLHHELAALHAELNKSSRSAPKPEAEKHKDVDDADSSLVADLEEQLGELSKALSDYTGSVEEFIAEHPLASVLGAFVLGLAFGRMMGRG